ncbi:MAG: DUF92 domain-containing protein [Acidobacteriota bacterium]
MGLFALALPFLTWVQAALCAVAAFLFNWLVLPRLLGHRLTSARPGVSDRGVLLYPLVVLALIVLFREDVAVAFGWGVLAFGDAAAGIVGQKWGRRALAWNPEKSWEGSIAFVLGAALGGSVLVLAGFVLAQGPADVIMQGGWARVVGESLLGTFPLLLVPLLLAALLESLPHGLDDNILPPTVAAFPLALLQAHSPWASVPPPRPDWIVVLGVNTACAVAALVTRTLRPGGVAVAWALGVATWMAFGRSAFLLLLAFLLAGLVVTFVGIGKKGMAGTAEPRGGRRGAAEVFGKGGVLLAFGILTLVMATAARAHPPDFGGRWGWVVVAILAVATADTWATEIGGLWGRRVFTLMPLREVAPGTPGGVSLPGLLGALAGAALISGLGAWLGMLGPKPVMLALVCTIAAFVATVVESLLPRLGPASHVGKNLVVTLLAPVLVFAVLGVLR